MFLSRKIAILCVSSLAGCTFPSLGEQNVDVGYIGTFTGGSAPSGTQAYRGAQLGAESWNLAHPKLQIQLHPFDDKGDPSIARKGYYNLRKSGIRAFIGPFLTSSAMALMHDNLHFHSVMIGPVIAGVETAGLDDYFFRLFPSTVEIGAKLGELAAAKRYQRIAIISDFANRDYSLRIFDSFVATLQQSKPQAGQILDHWVSNSSPPNTADLERKIRAWRKKHVDAILLILSVDDTLTVCKELSKQDFQGTKLSAPWAIDRKLLTSAATEGLSFYVPHDFESRSDAYQAFLRNYTKQYGETPSYYGTFNYDAVQVLGEGLRRAEGHTPDALKAALLSIKDFPGVQHRISFNEFGDSHPDLILHEVRQNKFVRVPGVIQ